MDRLSKKCFITSGIVHGTLVLVLIVGPAFLGSDESKFDPKEIIDFIPFKTIDQSLTGGGNPNVAQVIPVPTPPAPPPPRPEPPQPKIERRRPEPEPVKPNEPEKVVKPVERTTPKSDPDSLETTKPKISLKQVIRPGTQPTKDTAAETRAREKAAREKAERIVNSTLANIREGASGGVKVEDLRGPGGGGLPYAGFNQALISAYMRAWLIPSEASDENGKVVATITLSRDGTVISARISRSSGNAELDKSVQRALDKVSFVAPFPETTKDAQKTFGLEFDPKAKRLAG